MKDIALQLRDGVLVPFSDEDRDALCEYKPNQILKAKVTGAKKPRSYQQLKAFWKACELVAQNTENQHWNTKEKVAEQCKVAAFFVDTARLIVCKNGDVHVPYKSISYAELPHMEACRFFDKAFAEMAQHLGVEPEEFLKEAQF